MGAHDGPDGAGGLVGVVEGDGADVVVEDVGLDDAVEEVGADGPEVAVDGRGGAAGERPRLRAVVREGRVRVLQVGDGHEPVVDPEVGRDVPDGEGGGAVGVREGGEGGEREADAEVAEEDEVFVLALEEGARGEEVVDAGPPAVLLAEAFALGLAVVAVVACHVGEQVGGPAAELLLDEVDERRERGLLDELVQLVREPAPSRGVFVARRGHKHHVPLKVARGFVVLAVRDLPGEVRDEQQRVADPPDGVVEGLGRRERLVAALVGQDPQARAEEALDEGIQCPESASCQLRRNGFGGDVVVEEVEGYGQRDQIASHVCEAPRSGPLVAVSGNGITDLFDGVVRELELVAVGVDELVRGVLGGFALA